MKEWQKEILKKEKFNKNGLDKFQPLKTQTMKNTKTKNERIEDKITLFVIIIGITYFLVMTSRLFLNF